MFFVNIFCSVNAALLASLLFSSSTIMLNMTELSDQKWTPQPWWPIATLFQQHLEQLPVLLPVANVLVQTVHVLQPPLIPVQAPQVLRAPSDTCYGSAHPAATTRPCSAATRSCPKSAWGNKERKIACH